MKRFLAIILCLCLAFSLAACGDKNEEVDSTATLNKADIELPEIDTVDTEDKTDLEAEKTPAEETTADDAAADGVNETSETAAPEAEQAQEAAPAPSQEPEVKKPETAPQQSASSGTPSQTVNKGQTPTAKENRIVATSAAVCDITDRLGIDLVGVPETSVSAMAARYKNVTRVGSPMEPDMEIIRSLKPTDVITPDTLKADLEIKYNNINVKSTFVNLRSVQGLYDSVRLIGNKYGKSAEADEIIAEYKSFMAEYSSGHEGEPSPKVLVLMGLPGSYLVATQNSYAGSLVELAGGTNVFHHESKDFLTVNPEEILARDPDVIIRTAHGLPKEALEMFEKEFSTNSIWKHFRAVKEGRVYDVDYMLFGMSATFDYPQALAELEPMLYGKK